MKRLMMWVVLVVAAALHSEARAELKFSLVDANANPIPIAVMDFAGNPDLGRQIAQVIAGDLDRSGLFRPIDSAAFIERNVSIDALPNFQSWRQINAQAVVVGQLTNGADGKLNILFRLWDSFTGNQVTAFKYEVQPSSWRQGAHIVADAIYEAVTGEKGYFNTKIVYIAESGPKNRRTRRLAVMDQDGFNHRYLTDGRDMVLTPRYSPSAQLITYMSYKNSRPRVYVMDVETGRQELLGDFPGMTFAPRFTPDNNRVLMSLASGGNSDIYIMDLRTRRPTRLTTDPGIDTSPSFAPDGSKIVFNSDRGGSQQLYVMNADGSGVQRISFGQGKYATPVWSPRGDLIAFTKISGGSFYIGVMRPDGQGERLLSQSWLDEGPTWAPNGRVVIFFRGTPTRGGKGGSVKLMSVDLTGRNLREVPTPQDGSDPAWSGLLPVNYQY